MQSGALDVAFMYDVPGSENLVVQPITQIDVYLVSTQAACKLENAMDKNYIFVEIENNKFI